ncbi:hypothetical protein LCGC14_1908890 [marine sediment metagenome]|uniref:Rubrerythrin diiron-binding domain-containing protein n=1 Tax=marine sediment metagenome TaxID=412755 RepID=A0A0F9FU96_9ZZZZ
MKAEYVLGLLKELESKVSRLYTHFGHLFAGDKDAAEFFDLLSMDEESYGSVVQYQMRLVKKEPGAFGSVEVSEKEINSIMSVIDKTISSGKKLTLKQAVELSVKIEGTASESHFRTALALNNPALGELVRNLGVSDEEHTKRLRDFIVSRNL